VARQRILLPPFRNPTTKPSPTTAKNLNRKTPPSLVLQLRPGAHCHGCIAHSLRRPWSPMRRLVCDQRRHCGVSPGGWSWTPCQKEADINHRELIEAFRNNAEASTEEEGDRSAGWKGVKAVVRSAVPW